MLCHRINVQGAADVLRIKNELWKGMVINMIQELKGEECLTLRSLWEEVFYEDSEEFTDYYFKEKAKYNHAFTIQIKNLKEKEVVAMLHLAPYHMRIRTGQDMVTRKVNYMIGVATKESYRHRGYMGELLRAALRDMFHKNEPFTFLMPASPKIYTPYQFVYIYDRENYRIENFKRRKPELSAASLSTETDLWDITRLDEKEIPKLTKYAENYLNENYDVFIQRDYTYFRTMMNELKVQNGAVYLIHNRERKEEITGYFLYTEEEGKPNIQEAIYDNDFPLIRKDGHKPIIMARIVDLQSMLSLLRLQADCDVDESVIINIKVTDPLIVENNAVWRCNIGSTESIIEKDPAKIGRGEDCSITIEEMTSWIFGYRPAEDCFHFTNQEDKKHILNKLSKIDKFSKVFINEIV